MDTAIAFPRTHVAAALRKALPYIFGLYVVSLGTSMSGMEIFGNLLFALLGITLLIDPPAGFRWEVPPFYASILFFVGVVFLGVVFGDTSFKEKLYDLGRLRFYLIYVAVYYYFRWLSPSHKSWIQILAVTCAIVGVYGFLQHFIPMDLVRPAGKKIILYALPEEKVGPLVLGTFNHHLTFSSIFLFYACIFLSLGFYLNRQTLLSLGMLLTILCFWTQSRTVWVAIPVVLGILVYKKSQRWSLSVFGITALFLLAFWFFDRSFSRRVERTLHATDQTTEAGVSVASRIQLWRLQWEIFKGSPLLGVGWNNNERHCRSYYPKLFSDADWKLCGHAHSNVFQLLSTTGILGILGYLAIWVQIFLTLFRAQSRLPKGTLDWAIAWGLIAGFVGFHIQGLTQWNFGDAEVIHNLMFFWAVTASLSESVDWTFSRFPTKRPEVSVGRP